MRKLTTVVALAGLATATALVLHEGVGTVRGAFSAAGWGVLWASLFHFVPMALNARAWQCLFSSRRRRSLPFLTWLIWLREAVNGLLPVARIGGEVADARILIRRGVSGTAAVASLVVSMTVTLVTQLAFALLGTALLVARQPAGTLARAATLSMCAAVPAIVAIALAQRSGAFQHLRRFVGAIGGGRLAGLIPNARRLDQAVRVSWRRRGRVARCAAWQLAGWVAGAGEIWIFVRSTGTPMSATDAIMVESLVQAMSSAAFLVPAALGVQEGAFLALGAVAGLSPGVALAAALARRARDVIVFVPALFAWQATEGRALFTRARNDAAVRRRDDAAEPGDLDPAGDLSLPPQ